MPGRCVCPEWISVSLVFALTYGDVKNGLETGTVSLCLDLARIKKDTPYMMFVGSLGFQLLKEYVASRELLARQDLLFGVNKSSVERYFLRRAKKLSDIYDDDCLYGSQSLRVGFRTAMQESGLKRQSLMFFTGARLFSTKEIYKSRSKDEWRAEYAKHENSVTFQLKSQIEWRCRSKN
jgi:hypothetical protein